MSEFRPSLSELLVQVRACRACAGSLPHEPRPVLRVSGTARLLIVGQAPGRLVHETGIPWNDPSGRRLRQWLDMSDEEFYDISRVAIVPIGLCYPGTVDGADLPPRRECAPLWHARIGQLLQEVRLTLLVGSYAHAFYLGARRKRGMTETVAAHEEYLPAYLPLPHPSWRNTGWLKRNPWFESGLLPALRDRVRAVLG
ncbi:MAG: uracil-DNA glycosylase family protein [Betaproteobacteria bacterium]|nr:uracil-DNA glycosylase family protein [Betaproteobacteria bacterium]